MAWNKGKLTAAQKLEKQRGKQAYKLAKKRLAARKYEQKQATVRLKVEKSAERAKNNAKAETIKAVGKATALNLGPTAGVSTATQGLSSVLDSTTPTQNIYNLVNGGANQTDTSNDEDNSSAGLPGGFVMR